MSINALQAVYMHVYDRSQMTRSSQTVWWCNLGGHISSDTPGLFFFDCLPMGWSIYGSMVNVGTDSSHGSRTASVPRKRFRGPRAKPKKPPKNH